MEVHLRRAWLHQLTWEWQRINDDRLDGLLRPPVFQIDDAEMRLGRWQREARTIGISERHIWQHPWHEVVATLRHEMAHQLADEALGGDQRPHGERFQHACKMLRVDARASGEPSSEDTSEADRILSKVRKLLALAGSANQHESAAAMAAANTLLLRYNLELPSGAGRPDYQTRLVGEMGASISLQRKLVAAILTEFFFVECIWVGTFNAHKGRPERVLEVLGTSANLKMAAYVHDFLHASIDRLWARERGHLADGQRTRKREFAAGVLMGLRDRLRQERRVNEARGLVWLGDADLGRFMREQHPRTGTLSGSGVRRSHAHEAGLQAGRDLHIHRPVDGSPSGTDATRAGRLLPGQPPLRPAR